jgi:uncharacterized protein (DUF433 family)
VPELWTLGHIERRMDWRKIITIDPKVCAGKPCIRGLPITVAEIIQRIADGLAIDEVLAERTQLKRDDIVACLAFCADQERGRGF